MNLREVSNCKGFNFNYHVQTVQILLPMFRPIRCQYLKAHVQIFCPPELSVELEDELGQDEGAHVVGQHLQPIGGEHWVT